MIEPQDLLRMGVAVNLTVLGLLLVRAIQRDEFVELSWTLVGDATFLAGLLQLAVAEGGLYWVFLALAALFTLQDFARLGRRWLGERRNLR